jgi:hypothetical protein
MCGTVARISDKVNANRVLVGKSARKKTLVKPKRRLEDNTKMNLKDIK